MSFISRMRAEIAAKRLNQENKIKKLATESGNKIASIATPSNNNSPAEMQKSTARINTIELTNRDYNSFETCLSLIPEYNRRSVESTNSAKTEGPTL